MVKNTKNINQPIKTKEYDMSCLKDVKYLTKKKVLKMQPIYYVGAGLNIGNEKGKWWVVKLEGEKLEKALDNFLLYEDYRCFTTEQEANELMEKYNKGD